MADFTIKGAVAISGEKAPLQVFRAGREKEAAAYAEKAGVDLTSDRFAGIVEFSGARSGPDYDQWTKDDLEAEAESRELTVEGTGKDGNVLKADLVKALEAADAG